MNNRFNWTIGDWSGDGHQISKTFNLKCTHSAGRIREAYNVLCNRLGWWFHQEICSEYQEYGVSELAVEDLKKFGVDWDSEQEDWCDEELIRLFFQFMKLEVGDLGVEIVKDHSDKLFGFWIGQGEWKPKQGGYGNYSFGYGLYGG